MNSAQGKANKMTTTITRLITGLVCRVTGPAWRRRSRRWSLLRLRITSSPVTKVGSLYRSVAAGSVALIVVTTSALAIAPPEAVGSLYLSATGQYLCTASVVDGPELGLEPSLVVLTAAHCIEPYLLREPGSGEWLNRQGYQVGFGGAELFDVVPVRVGFADAGYDLAVLRFVAEVPELSPLRMGSWERVDFGSFIQNYANPLGLGIQYFTGSVTMLRIEPSSSNSRSRWFYNAVAALQVGPGSSGSLILTGTLEYVGVLSGVVEARIGSPFTVFVPQWKIVEFLNYEEAGRDVVCAEHLDDLAAGIDPDVVGRLAR